MFCLQNCIQYCVDSGYQEVEDLAKKINESLTLDEEHLSKLKKIVGDIFSEPIAEKATS